MAMASKCSKMEQRSKAERKSGCEISRAIVVGSIAFFLGKQAVEEHSHRWTIYLRGLENEDLSYFISKVVFMLHPSCSQPLVTVEKPPFQVTQTGWGEFQAKLQVHFVDPTERVLEMFHLLKLYPSGAAQSSNASLLRKPVVHESYDEIVFTDPTVSFYDKLMQGPPLHPGVNPAALSNEISSYFTRFSEVEVMEKIRGAKQFVKEEMKRTLKEIEKVEKEIDEVKAKPRAVLPSKAGVSNGVQPSAKPSQ